MTWKEIFTWNLSCVDFVNVYSGSQLVNKVCRKYNFSVSVLPSSVYVVLDYLFVFILVITVRYVGKKVFSFFVK